MRTLILYHPQSDHVGLVQNYVQDYIRFKGKVIELVSLETREGADLAKLYDVTSYPAVLVIEQDGHLMHTWQNGLLPLMDELSAYAGPPEDQNFRIGKKIIAPIHNIQPPSLHPAS
jgi:hypothetical protein